MNSAELSALMAAVRDCVKTVEELSEVVLAMPAQVAERLDLAEKSYVARYHHLEERIGACQAEAATILSATSTSTQTYAHMLETGFAEQAKIIADNRAVAEQTASALEELRTGHEQNITQTLERLAGVDSAIKAVHTELFDVQGRIDKAAGVTLEAATDYTAQQISTVKETIQVSNKTTDESIAALSSSRPTEEAISTRFAEFETKLSGRADELAAEVEGVTRTLADTRSAVQAVAEEVKSVGEVAEKAQESHDEFVKVQLPSLVDGLSTVMADQVKASKDDVLKEVENLNVSVREQFGVVKLAQQGFADAVPSLVKQIDEVRSHAETLVENATETFSVTSQQLRENIGEATTRAAEALRDQITQANRVSKEHADHVSRKVDSAVEQFQESVASLATGLRDEVTLQGEQFKSQLTVTVERVANLMQSLESDRTRFDANTAELVKSVEEVRQTLTKSIDDASIAQSQELQSAVAEVSKAAEATTSELEKSVVAMHGSIEAVSKALTEGLVGEGNARGEALAATSEAVAKAVERIDAVQAELAGTAERMLTEVRSIEEKLVEASGQTRIALTEVNARIEDTTNLHEEALEKMSANVEAVSKSVEAARTGMAEALELAGNTIEERLLVVTNTVGEQVSAVNALVEKAVVELGEEITQTEAEIRKDLDTALGEQRNNTDALFKGAVEAVDAVGKTQSAIGEHLTELSGRVDRDVQQVVARLVEIDTRTAEIETRTAEQLVAASAGISELSDQAKSLGIEIAAVKRAVAESGEALTQGQRETLAQAERSVAQLLEGINTRIGDGETMLTTLSGEVGAAKNGLQEVREMNSAAVQHANSLFDQVTKKIDELPEPAEVSLEGIVTHGELAEFEIKVLNKVAEIELPDPTLGAVFEDGELVVTLGLGSAQKTVRIPVDLGVKYRGVYADSKKYKAGDIVSAKGSAWVCNGGQTNAPGTDTTGWTLLVKRGADGRNVKSYASHSTGNLYMPGDFLRHNNILWQAAAKTANVPEGTARESSAEWTLIGGVQ